MRIDHLIAQLKTLAAQHGQDTPVYANGEPDLEEMEVSGIRFYEAEDIPDEMAILDVEPLPKRIYLKV